MPTDITSGVHIDPGRIAGTFSDGFAGVTDLLVGLAVAAGVMAIAVTVIRGYLSVGNEKMGLALTRIVRITLTISLVAFFAWGSAQLAASMGWQWV